MRNGHKYRLSTCTVDPPFLEEKGLYRASDILRKKKQNFAGFSGANSWKNPPISREKSQNSLTNRPISRDFHAEKIQVSKDFQGQIIGKIGRFHGKFRGKLRQEAISKKTADFAGFFWANFAKINQFCVDMTSVV